MASYSALGGAGDKTSSAQVTAEKFMSYLFQTAFWFSQQDPPSLQWSYVCIIISTLQWLSFPVSYAVPLPWDTDISFALETAGYAVRPDTWFRSSTSVDMPLVAVLLAFAYVALLIACSIYTLVIYNEQGPKYAPLQASTHILVTFLRLSTGILYIPIQGILLGPLSSQSDTFGLICGILGAFAWFIFSLLFVSLVLHENYVGQAPTLLSSPHGRLQAFEIIVKTALVACFSSVVSPPSRSTMWFLGLMCIGAAIMLGWALQFYMPFYNVQALSAHAITYALFVWSSLCLLVAIAYNDVTNDTAIVLLYGGALPCAALAWLWVRFWYAQVISTDDMLFQSPHAVLHHVVPMVILNASNASLRVVDDDAHLHKVISLSADHILVIHDINEHITDLGAEAGRQFQQNVDLFPESAVALFHLAAFDSRVRKNQHRATESMRVMKEVLTFTDLDMLFLAYKLRRQSEEERSATKDGQALTQYLEFVNHQREAESAHDEVAKLHYSFWSNLSAEQVDIVELDELGQKIHATVLTAYSHYQAAARLNNTSMELLDRFGKFTVNVLHDEAHGEAMIQRAEDIKAKKGVQALRLPLHNLKCLFHDTTAVVTVSGSLDTLGNIMDVNAAACQLYNRNYNEFVGSKIETIVPSPFAEAHDAFLRRFLQTGMGTSIDNVRSMISINKAGFLFPVEMLLKQVVLKGELAFVGAVRPVTFTEHEHFAMVDPRNKQLYHNSSGFLSLFGSIRGPITELIPDYPSWEEGEDDVPDDAPTELIFVKNRMTYTCELAITRVSKEPVYVDVVKLTVIKRESDLGQSPLEEHRPLVQKAYHSPPPAKRNVGGRFKVKTSAKLENAAASDDESDDDSEDDDDDDDDEKDKSYDSDESFTARAARNVRVGFSVDIPQDDVADIQMALMSPSVGDGTKVLLPALQGDEKLINSSMRKTTMQDPEKQFTRSVASSHASSSQSKVAQYKTAVGDIRARLLGDRHRLDPVMLRFSRSMMFTTVVVCVMALISNLAINSSLTTYESNLQEIRGSGIRRMLAHQLALEARTIELVNLGYLPASAAVVAKTRLSATQTKLSALMQQYYFDVTLTSDHVALYTTRNLALTEITHANATETRPFNLIDAVAKMVSNAHTLTQMNTADVHPWEPHSFFIVQNADKIIEALNKSTNEFAQASSDEVKLTQGIVMILAIALLVVICIVIFRPAVRNVQYTHNSIFEMFLTLPAVEVNKAAQEKLDVLSAADRVELGVVAIVEANVDGNAIKKKVKEFHSDRTSQINTISGRAKRTLWLQLGFLFVVCTIYFSISYVVDLDQLDTAERTRPEFNYAGRVQMFASQTFYRLRDTLVANAAVTNTTTQNWEKTYDQRHMALIEDLDSMNSFEQALLYGNPNMKLQGVFLSDTSAELTNLVLRDGCQSPEMLAMPNCATFDNGLIAHGLMATLLSITERYTNLAATYLPTFAQRAAVLQSSQMATFYAFVWPGYATNLVGVQRRLLSESVSDRVAAFLALREVAMAVFIVILIVGFVVVYRPLVGRLDAQLKRTKGMVLVIPPKLVKSSFQIRDFLTKL